MVFQYLAQRTLVIQDTRLQPARSSVTKERQVLWPGRTEGLCRSSCGCASSGHWEAGSSFPGACASARPLTNASVALPCCLPGTRPAAGTMPGCHSQGVLSPKQAHAKNAQGRARCVSLALGFCQAFPALPVSVRSRLGHHRLPVAARRAPSAPSNAILPSSKA